MNNLKTIRELRKVVEHTQGLIDNLTPIPDVTQVDYEPQFELGTRFCLANGSLFRYVKVDAGVVGTDAETGKELRNIHHRWLPRDIIVSLPVDVSGRRLK